MANRTPVVASNTSSLPEVLEDAAVLVNPENVFEIARAMKTVLLDEVLRQRLVQKGVEQVAKFSWKVAAERLLKIYEIVAAGQSSVAQPRPLVKHGREELPDASSRRRSSVDSPR
jgi:glycosyltransferase involved in cell wall biosynthesis